MNCGQEVRYAFDFRPAKPQPAMVGASIPRIARLMALAIRFEGLLREGKIRDYAELARRGRVTRARMTQIMKLLHLAPDIQERLLFLQPIKGLNERNLRPIIRLADWDEQRRMFHELTGSTIYAVDPQRLRPSMRPASAKDLNPIR
jgi:hypothetical protein